MPHDTLAHLAVLTRHLRDVLLREFSAAASGSSWRRHQEQFHQQTGCGDHRAFADAVAQAVTCGCYGWYAFPDTQVTSAALHWLLAQADPLLHEILQLSASAADPARHSPASHSQAIVAALQEIAHCLRRERIVLLRRDDSGVSRPSHPAVYFYEQFLQAYDHTSRRRQGVFYTPQPLVSFVVRSVDELLCDEFLLDGGIADQATWHEVRQRSDAATDAPLPHAGQPFVKVLDPAMGTGAFLLETVSRVHQRFRMRTLSGTSDRQAAADSWNDYVSGSLLRRVWGQELMLPALVIAQLAMTALLAETGYRFEQPGQLHLYLANTLRQPRIGPVQHEQDTSPFTIILGNPPFSGVSDNRHDWIRQLLRGRAPESEQNVANYFLAEGQPLGERKHWLEDDYVKFMRLAHWKIEVAGAGMIALVTNHGYLDNATFRGMREQLIKTFPRITLVDLHGNKRNGECGPAGSQDDSVFEISQGVAVSLLRRGVECSQHACCIRHAEPVGNASDQARPTRQPSRQLARPGDRAAPGPVLLPRPQERGLPSRLPARPPPGCNHAGQ